MLEAERQFRRVIGYRDLAKLVEKCISANSTMEKGTKPLPAKCRTPHLLYCG